MSLPRSFFWKFIVCLIFSVFTSFIHLQAQTEKLSPLYEQTSEVNNIMVQYYADYGNLTRFYVIRNSPERRERLISVVNQYLDKLSELEFERVNTSAKVDYVLFRQDLRELQYSLQKEKQEYNAIKGWVPFADSI
ncbi:MAG TPA: hypothetical protein VNS32_08695, partial [Flavisolibacter sp.]|nr:hypothetical protein [Flavisolibacter sp.]